VKLALFIKNIRFVDVLYKFLLKKIIEFTLLLKLCSNFLEINCKIISINIIKFHIKFFFKKNCYSQKDIKIDFLAFNYFGLLLAIILVLFLKFPSTVAFLQTRSASPVESTRFYGVSSGK
jgi:hypothetical protein